MHQSVFVRAHSYYSFLDGLASPSELAARAASLGYTSLALTDRGSLTGAIQFYEACRDSGIQPVIGLTLPIRMQEEGKGGDEGELILLAENLSGWSNLCRLSSALLTSPNNIKHNSVPFNLLAQHGDGLLCLAGANLNRFTGPGQHLDQNSSLHTWHRLVEIFPGRLFLEHPIGAPPDLVHRRLHVTARRFSIPVVDTLSVYHLEPSEVELRKIVTAIRLNVSLASLPDASDSEMPGWLPAPQELIASSSEAPTTSALEIIARCQWELPLYTPRLPELDLPPGVSPLTRLRNMAYAGAQRLYGSLSPEIEQRLQHELSIIAAAGYSSLFLIMAEIMSFSRQADIPTASRGSASSSLVAHCLDITTPDPIRLNLYFERFLNPARRTPPDIDTDVCSVRRDQLIRFVVEKYGADRVAMVATINRFRSRSALREVAKVFGYSQRRIRKLVDDLPWRGWRPARLPVGQDDPYSTLKEKYTSSDDQAIFSAAAALIDHPNHLSVHPGGVIIAPTTLTDLLPTALSSKGIVITQFDLEGIEKLGLIKIDLLGIRGLTVLGDVADNLRSLDAADAASTPRSRLSVLGDIPAVDQATSDLLCTGETIGCFQIESPGMRATLRAIQARSIDDVLVALALYRPGPMTGGLKEAFIRRHLGKEPVCHLHPALAPLLDDTYGVILYQEQVLRIAHELAGLSLADADLLRRAMSHFDPGKQMDRLKKRFLQGAQVKSGVPPDVGEHIWELMAAFAGYGFPKAHAASYAEVAWRSAWCKAHFPAQFMAAVLANWGGYYSQRVYVQEVRRLGIRLRAPHINHSQAEFSVKYIEDEPVIFMGLDQVRDLSRQTIGHIITRRPFHSLPDFLSRANPRPQELDNLIRCGSLVEFGTISELLESSASINQQTNPRQLPLFLHEPGPSSSPTEWTREQLAAAQEALLGISIDVHPLELVKPMLASFEVITSVEAAGHIGERVRVAGIRQSWRRTRTLDGDTVFLLTLEDLHGSLVVLLEPQEYQRFRSLFVRPQPLIVEGFIEPDEETSDYFLRAEKIWPVRQN